MQLKPPREELNMNEIQYKDLNVKLLCIFFPEYKDKILQLDSDVGNDLPHVLYGNFFNPLIKSVLKNHTKSNIIMANRIFDFYEELAISNDDEVRNLLQVTLLENLWDDYDIYIAASKYMRVETQNINKEINSYLSPPAR